jgi:hypothetical protein
MVVAVVGALAGAAGAQSSEADCTLFGAGAPVVLGTSFGSKTGLVLTLKTSFEQKLPDGNYIRGYVRTHEVRDSAGRFRSEAPLGCYRDDDGKIEMEYGVHVSDPVSKESFSWEVGPLAGKVVRATHARTIASAPAAEADLEESDRKAKVVKLLMPPHGEYKTDDLGTRTIAGVVTHGTRTTRTIPAGEEGNELPLTTVQEEWRAPGVGVMLMISDDPRSGRTTSEVEEMTRGEPDASLFAPPPGYKVVFHRTVTEPAETQAGGSSEK